MASPEVLKLLLSPNSLTDVKAPETAMQLSLTPRVMLRATGMMLKTGPSTPAPRADHEFPDASNAAILLRPSTVPSAVLVKLPPMYSIEPFWNMHCTSEFKPPSGNAVTLSSIFRTLEIPLPLKLPAT